MLTLRDYQTRALMAARDRIRAGVRRLIYQSPTGSGKTILAVAMILVMVGRKKRILFVAHRKELLDQAIAKLILAGMPETLIGVIRAGDKRVRPDAPVQVASIQSLRALPRADFIIIDEAHRSGAASYKRLFEHYIDAVIIGLTATPERLDGLPLDMFQEIIVVAQPRDLAMAGYIMSPICYSVDESELPDLSEVKKTAGDYNKGQLSIAVSKRKIIGSITEHWKARAEGRSTIAYAVTVDHSKLIIEAFRECGVTAAHLDAKTPMGDREVLLGKFSLGEILVLSQVDLLVEGIDIPRTKCIVQARPTESLTIYLQSIGRELRPWNNVIPILLDHAGNVRVHLPPMESREYSLSGRTKRPRDPSLTRTCVCYAILAADARVCDSCGHKFDEATSDTVRKIRTKDGFLVAIPQDEASVRQQYWAQLAKEAIRIGYKREWVAYKFKDKFGTWPPDAFQLPDRPQVDDLTKRRELTKLRGIEHRAGYPMGWATARFETMFNDTVSELSERELLARRAPVPTTVDSLAKFEDPDIGL